MVSDMIKKNFDFIESIDTQNEMEEASIHLSDKMNSCGPYLYIEKKMSVSKGDR